MITLYIEYYTRRGGGETAIVTAQQRDYSREVAIGSLETWCMARNTLLAASND